MSNRVSYAFAVLLLLLGAVLRFHDLAVLPPGLSSGEIDTVRVVETVRAGTIEAFYNLRGEGREPLYEILVSSLTVLTGTGLIGYRFLSVCAGMLTLAFVYVLGKRLFGARAGLVAMGSLAVTFASALLSRSIVPEALLPLFTAATLVALAQSLSIYKDAERRVPNTIAFAVLGLVMGFGFYVHPLHIALVLAVMLFVALFVLSRQSVTAGGLSFTSFGILIMIIVTMPYLIASLRQPELAGAARLVDQNGPVSPIGGLVNGLFGFFFRGDLDPTHNLPGRPLLDLFSGFILLIGLLVAARGWRQPRYALILLPFVVLLPFVTIARGSPDFTRFAPLLPLSAVLFAVGIETVASLVRVRRGTVVTLLLLGLLAFNIAWVWRDLFEVWPTRPDVETAYRARLGQLAHYLDRTAAALPTVICTPELYPPDEATELIDAQILALMMNRANPELRYADCGSGLVLARGGGPMQVAFLQADGYRTINPYLQHWLNSGRLPDGDAGLPPEAVVRIDVQRELADTIGRFTTTAPASYAPETGLGDRLAQIPVRLGGNIAFLGYDPVPVARFGPGAVVPVYTYWRVDGVVPADLRLFTHLLSDPSVITAQADTLSVRSDLLEPRDVVVQATFLQLPFTIPAGTYILSTGAYEASLGTRLGVFEGDQLRGDRLFIGTIEVVR